MAQLRYEITVICKRDDGEKILGTMERTSSVSWDIIIDHVKRLVELAEEAEQVTEVSVTWKAL